MNKINLASVSLASLLALSACTNSDPDQNTDSLLSSKITALSLTGDPTTGRTLPSITDAKAQLGMKLFFTKGLGGDQDSACVTCHHPALGGGDDLSLSIGVNAVTPDLLGPGRRHSAATGFDFDGGPTVPRNAPTTFNLGLWDEVLFHDGRVESLDKTPNANGAGNIRTPDSAFGAADANAGPNLAAAQSRFPVTSPEEMRGDTYGGANNTTLRTALEARMQGGANTELAVNNWQQEFNAAFGGTPTITYPLIADAIGEYERSQVFINNPWKSYVAGNTNAISDDAKQGALLFFNTIAEGGANCASCHSSDFFTDEGFHVIAMPQIGRGKGNGTGDDDFGRFRETAVAADMYAFRTPSLLNVEVYGPWGHAGGYTTLEAVVKHHSNPQTAIDNYDFNQLEGSIQATNMTANTQLAMNTLAANRTAGVITPVLQDTNLTDDQIAQVVSFLKALTDPCVKSKSCLAPWVPNAGDTNPDALRIIAIDNNGNIL
jgi:cytochrome c peroxidase